MSNLVSILGTKLINLMSIKSVEDTDYLIVQKNTSGDRSTRKILHSDYVAEVLDGLSSDDVNNESSVTGTTVTAALNALNAAASGAYIILDNKAAVLANGTQVSDEITLNQGNYYFGDVDLVSDVLIVGGGTLIQGGTATSSKISTNSTKPTITVKNGGFAASSIQGEGGLEINNTGTGAAIRVQDTDTICFLSRLLTRNAGTALEVNDSNCVIESWTVLSGVTHGLVMTGVNNTGPIIRDFNPIGITGRMIDIQGSIASGALRIENLLGTSTEECVMIDAASTVPSMEVSGDILSLTKNAIKIPGTISEGLLFNRLKAISGLEDACDITGASISNFTCTSTGLIAGGGVGKAGLKGNAESDTSILPGGGNISAAAIVSDCSVQGVGTGGIPLSGITKKDLNWTFKQAGPQIVDSTDVGGFLLDSATTTTINTIGADVSIVSVADNGGGFARFDIGASYPNGTNVYVKTATEYDHLGVMANVTATTFDLLTLSYTATDTGTAEIGWEKISGTTSDIETIERFDNPNDNELRLLDAKTLPVTSASSITSVKSGSARLFEFGLFKDPDGSGFKKMNGSYVKDVSTRTSSITGVISFELESQGLISLYTRNMETTDNIDIVGMSINVIRD